MSDKKKVLLIGSSIKCKGGIATVIKNYLNCDLWENYKLYHLVTHVDGNKFVKFIVFIFAFIKLFFQLIFNKIDIIHIHMSMNASFYRKAKIIKLCKLFHKKIIVHQHGSKIIDFFDSLNDKKKEYFIDILSSVDTNIVLSKNIQNEFKKISNLIVTNVVYNAVQIYENNKFNKDGTFILFLGRMGQRKGTFDLLEAIKMINDDIDSKYKFIFCGDGEVEKVNKYIQVNNLSQRCIVKGWINSLEEKEKIFSNTILNILPSYNEGLPMSILETMAYGIPNLSTEIASIPEVINESNGFLIKPGNVGVLSENIIKYLSLKNEEKKSLSKNSYDFICQNFDLKRSIFLVRQIYKSLGEKADVEK